ncbi:hypothetical protein WN944_023415 [Citrus x changshan-huyou]|uniref:Root meristem growth factor 9 n=3 Tax=Citrus TaxID=2706 RepID=A0A067F0V2_CITSI|nr:hypothetical protein CISIN_1g034855mg [Citrus sinensis]GAY60240.1 hypothetical protein CUMW_200420 [Citrus unshiu]
MARVSSKHLIFVFFIFLCFISITNGARSLRAAPPSVVAAEKGQDDVFIAPAEESRGKPSDGDDDLVTADYTPARRKPPIHN